MTTYTTQKISARTDAGAITGAEILPVVRTGDTVDYRTTIDAIVTYLQANPAILQLLEDNFGEHIVEGFDAIFGDVRLRNTGDTSQWLAQVDADGNLVFALDTGLAGTLVLNGGGNVTLGLSTFRTQIVSDSSTSYTLKGSENKARLNRFTGSGAVTVTMLADADVVDPTLDLFYTNDWFILERNTTQTVTFSPGSGVTITNAHTGATGAVAITRKGGQMLVRRTGLNAYVVWGDIAQRRVETVVAVTSSSGVLALDWSLGNVFTCTLTENITSITYSNLPSGVFQAARLRLTNHASSPKTVTGYAAGTKWRDGAAPTMTATNGAIDEIGLDCYGDGTTVLAKYIQNYQ